MKSVGIIAGVLNLLALVWTADAPTPSSRSSIVLNGHTFTLPEGFTVEIAARPPLVDRPITADFDDQGRLYVTESSGSNENVQEQLKKKPHRILRLEDVDGDGVFDRRTVFAEGMMFPEGSLWFDGSLYVAAPPSIWRLTDTNGDGVADERVEWFAGKTLTGCANDLHGPYAGPDGWIYWCKGAFARQVHERPGRPPFETRASHIFRCRPDGTGLEPVMTGGMDNPVDVVFTPAGERIFTTTFFQHPAGGKRDGLIHAIYGGIYGKDHDVIHDRSHRWTSPSLMPVLTHMGAAAPCGLVRYESSVFGADHRDNIFACQFNMHKVSRHVLRPEGATFATQDHDFLVSSNLDFHPTDVIEDADGSLIVVDTGGWYKLCCPTSQLHKPDILGAIYRVRKQGTKRIEDPRGVRLAWEKLASAELVKLLGDPRPAIRQRAMAVLARRGREACGALEANRATADALTRLGIVWAATRIDAPEARQLVRGMLADPDESVRQAALHSISLWRDRGAILPVRSLLSSSSAHNRRGAAEALGRIGEATAVQDLLAALAKPVDRALEHSLTYALIEIGNSAATRVGARSEIPAVRRAALIALDQMDDGELTAALVAAELSSRDPGVREAAWWIASRHPEWGAELAGVLQNRLNATSLSSAEADELVGLLGRFARTPTVQALLAERAGDAAASPVARTIALRAMAQSAVRETPGAWLTSLAGVLGNGDVRLRQEAVVTIRSLPMPKQRPRELSAALLAVGSNAALPLPLRLSALAAVPGGLENVPPPLFDLLRDHLKPDREVVLRSQAVDVIHRARLNPDQQLQLTESLKSVGPMEIDRVLEAFTGCSDDRVGLALVSSLKAAPALSALRGETIRPRLAKFGKEVQREAEEIYARVDVNTAQQRARLDELLGTLKNGDVRRGQLVFHSPKAACASCHAVGYLGGKIGPDLTHIARIRTERDLLEAVVFPSASLVRSYEPIVVLTRDGKVINGNIKRDDPEELVLTVSADQEARIPRAEIEAVRPSKNSIMPAGLDQQLTPQELADLVAFLKACR